MLDSAVGLCYIHLLLSPQYVLTSLTASRLSSLSILVLTADLLEFMNVKRSRSIFIEVAKKLSTLWPGNMFYISLYVNAELLSNKGRKTPINGKHEYKST